MCVCKEARSSVIFIVNKNNCSKNVDIPHLNVKALWIKTDHFPMAAKANGPKMPAPRPAKPAAVPAVALMRPYLSQQNV